MVTIVCTIYRAALVFWFLLLFSRVLAWGYINPIMSWHTTCSDHYPRMKNDPNFCIGIQVVIWDGCVATRWQRFEHKIEQSWIRTEGSGIKKYLLFIIHIEQSKYIYSCLTTRFHDGCLQVNHLVHAFREKDPELLIAGVELACSLTGSTFSLFSANLPLHQFVATSTDLNAKIGLLSDALHANGATTNLPKELLIADYIQYTNERGRTDRSSPTSSYTLTGDTKDSIRLEVHPSDLRIAALHVQYIAGCDLANLLAPTNSSQGSSILRSQDDVDQSKLDLDVQEAKSLSANETALRALATLTDARAWLLVLTSQK